MLGSPGPTPSAQIDCAHDDAEYVRGDETKLCCSNANDADENTVNSGQRPAFPASATD